MNDVVPTVLIKTKAGPARINMSDYDSKKHQLADVKELPPLKPLDPATLPALIGSSIQPSSWNLLDGKVLQLGTVVAEAHKRSGMTVEQWNAQAMDVIEKAIAEVVAEMVPAATEEFTVGKSTKRGHGDKFVVLNAKGKPVGEEYETKEDAEAQAKILNGQESK